MRSRKLAIAFAVLAGLSAACSSGSKPTDSSLGLQTVADVRLPGDTSRFDYASFDPTRHRLYISHLGASQVVVVDTSTMSVERTLDHVASVHGVLVVPSVNRVYAAATSDDQVVTYDATSLQEISRAPTGQAPDGFAYDPDTNAVFVSNEDGPTVTEIDARTRAARGDIDIGGQAGNVNYDPTSKQVLVDIQSSNEIAVIDPTMHRVVDRHPVPGCDHDHGLQVDPDRHRIFVACDGNARLVELTLPSFAVTATVDTGADPDVLTVDPAAARLYVLAESGIATVIDTSTQPARLIARGYLADKAHSGTVDSNTHKLYVPIANVAGHPVLRVLAPAGDQK